MRKYALIFLTLMSFLVVFFVACGRETPSEVFEWEWDMDALSPFYGETITLVASSLDFPGNYRVFARMYMELNPGVTIEIIDLGDDVEHARMQIGMQLMAGVAPTIISQQFVDVHQPASEWLFADWQRLVDAHPNFNEDDWFMNVIQAAANDTMLVFPLSFYYFYIVANDTVPGLVEALEGRQDISMADMIELYSRLNDSSADDSMYLGNFHGAFSLPWVASQLVNDFFDIDTGRVEFDNPQFIEIMNIAGGATNAPFFAGTFARGNRETEAFLSTSAFFRLIGFDFFEYFSIFEQDTLFSNPMRLVNHRDELIIYPNNAFVLNAGATPAEQALALDFLMFFTSLDIDPWAAGSRGFAGERFTYRNLSRFDSDLNEPAGGVGRTLSYFYNNWQLALNAHQISQNIFARTTNASEMPMATERFAPWSIEDTIFDIIGQFEYDLITSHQMAMDLQNRITLALMEMGMD